MNIGILILLTLFISAMIFIIQRAEAKRRRLVILVMLAVGELIRRYVIYRSEWLVLPPFGDLLLRVFPTYPLDAGLHREAWLALGIALVLNFFFWALIGRYNPVASSDEIQVIGMDD